MAKRLVKKYPKYKEKVVDSLIIVNEIWVYFYEPKRNMISEFLAQTEGVSLVAPIRIWF